MMFEPTPTPTPNPFDQFDGHAAQPKAGPGALVPLTPPPVRLPPAQTPDQARKEKADADLAEWNAHHKATDPNNDDPATYGQKQVDKAYAKDFVDWRTNGFADAQKAQTQLRSAINNLQNSDGSVSGWVTGNTPDFVNYVFNPKAIDTREQIQEIVQRNLRVVLGAQFTEKEGTALINRAFNPRLSEAENAVRLNRLLKQISDAAQAKESAAKWFEQHGTLKGWQGTLASTASFDPESGEGGTQLSARVPTGEGDKAGSDEVPVFNGDAAPVTGGRFTPEQASQVAQMLARGNYEGASALAKQFGGTLDPASANAAIKYAKAHPGWVPDFGYGQSDQNAQDAHDKEDFGGYLEPALKARKGQVADPLVRGAANSATAGLADIGEAGFDALGNPKGFWDSLKKQRAINEADRRENPGLQFAGNVAGALLLPSRIGGAMNMARAEATTAGAATRDVIAAGRTAGARRAAIEGGIYGTVYGGAENIESPDRLSHAAVGGLTGALAGYGVTQGLGRLADRFGGGRGPRGGGPAGGGVTSEQAARSADALDIVMPKYVGGGPAQQQAAAAVEKSPFGIGPIREAQDRFLTTGANARDKIATDAGRPMDPIEVGDNTREALKAWRATSRNSVGRLYDTAKAQIGDSMVSPRDTIQEVGKLIREEQQSLVDTPAMGVLQNLTDKLANGDPVTVEGARATRTALRDSLSQSMTPSNADRITNRVMAAIQSDVERDAPQAAASFKIADAAHRERLTNIRDVLEPFIGKKGDNWGSDVAKRLAENSRGNGERLEEVLRLMPKEAADDVRATLISRLGQAGDGAQNAAGDTFSFDTFLTNWNQIKGSRERIFSRETFRALNQLAEVAEKAKQAGRARNHSNTGSITARGALFRPVWQGIGGGLVLGSASGSSATGFATAAAGVGVTLVRGLSQHLHASSLAQPTVVRRIANTPGTVSSALRYWRGGWVKKMAASEPSIAADLLGLQDYMVKSLSGSVPGRVAAEGGQGDQKQK